MKRLRLVGVLAVVSFLGLACAGTVSVAGRCVDAPTGSYECYPADPLIPTTSTSTAPVAAGFSMSVDEPDRTVVSGRSAIYTVRVNRSNFSEPVTLSVSGLPSKASATFTPNPVTDSDAASTLTVSTSKGTPVGTYSLTITGSNSDGSMQQATNVSLTVTRK